MSLASYRLQDLSAALKISHERPHQADSDAIVTAELLIKLMDQIHQLPDSLLRQLESMGDALLFETGMLFSNELRNRNAPKKYDADLIQVGKITFRRPRKFSDHLQGQSKQPLLEAWPSSYEKRPQQLNLMEDDAFPDCGIGSRKPFLKHRREQGKRWDICCRQPLNYNMAIAF